MSGETSELIGVEVVHQSGRVTVAFIDQPSRHQETMFNILRSQVGRAHEVDGVKSVRMVVCRNPLWEAS